jgi:hypothetical protein
MPSLKMLDSLIAIVGVILVLSLIVQSLQGALKKALKIKSRQIEDSLLDLFENTLGLHGTQTQGIVASSPVLRLLFLRKHPSTHAAPEVQALMNAVAAKFRDIGRVAQSGRWILDSLSKDDLLKVLARVAPGTLLPNLPPLLVDVCRQVDDLASTLAGVEGSTLSGQASAQLARLRQAVDPLINDVKAIYKVKVKAQAGDAQPGGAAGKGDLSGGDPQTVVLKELDPTLLVGDALRLREVKLEDVLGLLTELQKEIDRDLATRQQAGQDAQALEIASTGLKTAATQITDLHAKLDLAIAPLRNRLSSVEVWFDTVMQSFDERYTRGMRTWSLVLSLIVVIALNANFFTIAGRILYNADTRTAVVNAVTPDQKKATKEPQPAGAVTVPPTGQPQTVQDIAKDTQKAIEPNVALYNSLGFGLKSREDLVNNPVGTLAGWLAMAMLLSVGAPFWQDTLESLFGVKNLLRKNADIKNVEQQSGQGNPKAA